MDVVDFGLRVVVRNGGDGGGDGEECPLPNSSIPTTTIAAVSTTAAIPAGKAEQVHFGLLRQKLPVPPS